MGPFKQRSRRQAAPQGSGFGLPILNDAEHLLAYEFARARRYERPISIIALDPADIPADTDLKLRFCDMLCIDSRIGVALVVLPETNAASLAGTVQRVRGELPPHVRLGAASFPDDALTLDEIVQMAAAQLRGAPASEVA